MTTKKNVYRNIVLRINAIKITVYCTQIDINRTSMSFILSTAHTQVMLFLNHKSIVCDKKYTCTLNKKNLHNIGIIKNEKCKSYNIINS